MDDQRTADQRLPDFEPCNNCGWDVYTHITNGMLCPSVKKVDHDAANAAASVARSSNPRDAFERWARDNIGQFSASGYHATMGKWVYNHNFVDMCWRCWQAARAADESERESP